MIVGESVGSKIKAGSTATVLSGPCKVMGVSGIYRIADEYGVQEEFHESRLSVARFGIVIVA